MNKALSIQRSKLNTSYGGVGSTIDTIENLAYKIEPFDKWPIYQEMTNNRVAANYRHLIHDDTRLLERLKQIGFQRLEKFFLTDSFENEDVEEWNLTNRQKRRMVSSTFFPRMFYCPHCHRLQSIDRWEGNWHLDNKFKDRVPKCSQCSKKHNKNVKGPNLIQVRFVLASMETGDIQDLPWGKIYSKKNKYDGIPNVWDFTGNIQEYDATFNISKGSSDLIDIYVKANGITVSMAVIMNHYFIMKDNDGNTAVYRPVIRSANNVYYAYVVSSVYIPRLIPTQQDIETIKTAVEEDQWGAEKIKKRYTEIKISVAEIQKIIDNKFIVKREYQTEEMFRLEEFDFLTDTSNYSNDIFQDGDRLFVKKHLWKNPIRINFIKQLYLLKRVNVTSAQVAYSRIDKISSSNLSSWKGKSDTPKSWYDIKINGISQDVDVALHPTCTNKDTTTLMPVVSAYGEGFFVEFDVAQMPKSENEKAIFLHTFAHLVMKMLEFSCGYSLSSMSERLYILPQHLTKGNEDKYGFMIYCANGEAGSYGGITSLFESGVIEKIFIQALDLAGECPNDPICESEGGSCFACVQIPETACELFNTKLDRTVILNHIKNNSTNAGTSPSTTNTQTNNNPINVDTLPSTTKDKNTNKEEIPKKENETDDDVILA